ncbi:MAG: hypothetical protein HOV80_05980, partial [Polyangiaceae bacterium]|nr:hypothetical protein [Polyangiaceae bacterium]
PKAPFFPPPPKAEPPYRAPAPRAPSTPVEPPKPKVTVSRPEPPKQPAQTARTLEVGDRAAAYKFVRAGELAGRKHTDNPLLQALVRWPRPTAFVLFALFGGNFLSGVHSLAELFTEGQAWVTKQFYMHLFAGLAAGAAFIVACGIPYDDEKERLPPWFVMGFFAVAIGAAAAKDQIVSLLLPLF